MAMLAHVTVSELQEFLQSKKIDVNTKVTVIFENNESARTLKELKAIQAVDKLKGSGNGKLVAILLKDRMKEKEL